MVYFFFSSRRWHTIWPRDWSSDVCSSDLNGTPLLEDEAAGLIEVLAQAIEQAHCGQIVHRDLKPSNVLLTSRSEERRVGKECMFKEWRRYEKNVDNCREFIVDVLKGG